MAYLAKSDYTLSIAIDHLDEILEQAALDSGLTPDNVLANAEAWAKALIKSYLVGKYDINTEFAKNSPDPGRNILVMQVMIDLSLCQIHKTINPRDIPELREKACDAAMQWLKDARDGVVIVDLPPAPVDPGQQIYNTTYLNSNKKFVSKPFSNASLFDGKCDGQE
jgi:hypothetical protein